MYAAFRQRRDITEVGAERWRCRQWNADVDVCLNGTETKLLMTTV